MFVEYKNDDVLVASQARISKVFDEFARVIVSISSGKDSTVLYYLALQEAEKRGRRIGAFFLDQEAEYQSTEDLMGKLMQHPLVDPLWFQVPILMTNATSHKEYFLYSWEQGKKWIHTRHPLAIPEINGEYPKRFHNFFHWYEGTFQQPIAFLIGLRSKESLHRFRAISMHPAYKSIPWSTKTKSDHVFRFYPIYDWTFGDVWKFIWDNNLPYNRIYDYMFVKYGINMSTMRISNLIHEKSFKALADLQEFEPSTYDRFIERLGGVHCAAMYARDAYIYSNKKLPPGFNSWVNYRDYLLKTTTTDKIDAFLKRFKRQKNDEVTAQAQVKQILCNDWEGNLPANIPKTKNSEILKLKWWDIL